MDLENGEITMDNLCGSNIIMGSLKSEGGGAKQLVQRYMMEEAGKI